MAKYLVTATAIQNYVVVVEAADEKAALEAGERIGDYQFDEFEQVGHEFTVDSAELMGAEED